MNEFDELIKKYTESPTGWKRWLISSKNEELRNKLSKIFPELGLSEKLYWLKNGLTERPKCPVCGKEIFGFGGQTKGYNKHCSSKCTQRDSNVRKKQEDTCLELYGATNVWKSQVIKDKIKKTCLERYGSENIFSSEVGKRKIKDTNLKKYGVENPQQNKKIHEKTMKTNEQRYGTTCPATLRVFHKSKGEAEVFEFVRKISSDVRASDRKQIWPYEIDIYVPSKNIGIEYDGDYWHNLPDMVKRDQMKDDICKEKGIQLIRIKESDWKNRKHEVEKLLEEKLS